MTAFQSNPLERYTQIYNQLPSDRQRIADVFMNQIPQIDSNYLPWDDRFYSIVNGLKSIVIQPADLADRDMVWFANEEGYIGFCVKLLS